MNQKNIVRTVLTTSAFTLAFVFLSSFGSTSVAYALITNQLDFGARGEDVTEVQSYLSTNPNLYPSGRVTGYFGSLTQEATQKFQIEEGIVSSGNPETTGFGRVGPITMSRLNTRMGFNYSTPYNGDAAPIMNTPVLEVTNTTATLTWLTNEPTLGQVHIDSVPLQFGPAAAPRQQQYVSGKFILDGNDLKTLHTMKLDGLTPGMMYYILVGSTDSVGNTTTNMPSTFRTNNN